MRFKKSKKPNASTQNLLSIGCDRETNTTIEMIVVINPTINISVDNRRVNDKNQLLSWLKALAIAVFKQGVGSP